MEGVTIKLIEFEDTGRRDAFHRAIMEERVSEVENVLYAPSQALGIPAEQDINGRKLVYQLGIPKGDNHKWSDCEVEFLGRRWKVIGDPKEGIENLIPLNWNKIVTVECNG